MLLSLLRSIRRHPAATAERPAAVGRVQDMVRLATLAAGAPLEQHLEILYRDVKLAGLPLETLVDVWVLHWRSLYFWRNCVAIV